MAQVRTRKRGKTYSYIFEAGKTPEGKRKVIEKGGFPTKEEAYNAGTEAYIDYKHGNIGITSNKLLLSDYLVIWLKSLDGKVRETSKLTYQSYIKKVNKYIGTMELQELRPKHIDKMITSLYTDGYSYKTISTIKAILHTALDYAVYPCELIQANPMINIKVPAKAPQNIVKRSIITNEMFADLLEAAKKNKVDYITPLMISYHTGMRLGEVFGLLWENIDLGNKRLVVKYNYIYRLHKFKLPLKSKSSYRTLYIDDVLADYLKELLERRKKAEVFYHTYAKEDGTYMQTTSDTPPEGYTEIYPVVCNDDGKLYSTVSFTIFLRKNNLNSHSFRHTQATLLAEANANPKNISARLGHSTIKITQDLYTHVTDKMQQETMALLSGKLNADKTSNADKMQTSRI